MLQLVPSLSPPGPAVFAVQISAWLLASGQVEYQRSVVVGADNERADMERLAVILGALLDAVEDALDWGEE